MKTRAYIIIILIAIVAVLGVVFVMRRQELTSPNSLDRTVSETLPATLPETSSMTYPPQKPQASTMLPMQLSPTSTPTSTFNSTLTPTSAPEYFGDDCESVRQQCSGPWTQLSAQHCKEQCTRCGTCAP